MPRRKPENLGVGYRAGKAKHKVQCATAKRWNKAIAKALRAKIISKERLSSSSLEWSQRWRAEPRPMWLNSSRLLKQGS